MAPSTQRWLNSCKSRPCPICGRVKDGDCRQSADGLQVICHRGSSHSPPDGLKPSREPIEGLDGQLWAFTHDNDHGAHFTLHKPLDKKRAPRKVVPFRRPSAAAPINGPIELASLRDVYPDRIKAAEAVCRQALARWLEPAAWAERVVKYGYQPQRYYYGSDRWVVRKQEPGCEKKDFQCWHTPENGIPQPKAGPDPWPVYNEELATGPGIAGLWLLEVEGEKSADWAMLGGLIAISQPGHAHKVDQIAERYRSLKAAGVAGIVFLSDNDKEGQRRADQAVEAAAQVQLPLMVLPAIEVWPDLPVGGSIDDAPGTAAERVIGITAAIAKASQTAELSLRQPDSDREPTMAERITEAVEALLQATLADDQSEIDASMGELWKLGVSRERSQERLLMLWAERHGYNLSHGGGQLTSRGRIFGKAKEGAGLRQLLPGFLLDRDLHLLVADASSGKTLAAAELATVMSARDRGFLDHEAPRADAANDPRDTVLVIASDGEASAYSMWETYLQDLSADERGATVEIWAQDDDTGEQAWNASLRNLDRLVQRLHEGDVCLVVMDTANSVLRGAGVNTGVGPIEAYLRLLKQIVCRHCALLMIHHTNRSGKPDLKGIGGHPAFQEVPSVIHLIEPKRQADGSLLRLWHVLKLRGSNYRRFAYELRDGRLVVTEGHLFENCDEQVLVALHTQLLVKAGTAPGELIRVTKRPPQSVYNALDRLRGAKLVRRQGNGYRLTPSGRAAVDGMRV